MNKQLVNMEQLSKEELAEVNGGIPYEKPMFFLLDGVNGLCSGGTVCSDGSASTGLCEKGSYCTGGKFNSDVMPEK